METHTVCLQYPWTPWSQVQCPAPPLCEEPERIDGRFYISLYVSYCRVVTHTVCPQYPWTPLYPVQCPAPPVCTVPCTLPTTPPHWMALIYHAHLLFQDGDTHSMSAVSLDSLVSSTMPSTSSMYGTVRSQNVDSVFFAKPSASISQRGSTKS